MADKRKQTNKEPALTPDEMAIFQRVKGETDDWKTITEDSVDDYSLMQDPFRLPEEVKNFELKKEFKFRWVERKAGRLDELRSKQVPNRWWIVNLETFPTFEDLFDPVMGTINREDQMLVFKPWWMHVKRMEMLDDLNAAQERSGTLEGKDGETRDGASFIAGKRNPDDPHTMRGEIKAGDKVEYQETGNESQDFGDLIDDV